MAAGCAGTSNRDCGRFEWRPRTSSSNSRSRPYTLEGVAQRITCPVLVCQAAGEHFDPGQAEKLASALGDRATLRSFTAAESAACRTPISVPSSS